MNSLVVTFNNPVAVSAVNIWNYSKTPTRGVREIEVFCDDALVFRVRKTGILACIYFL